MRAIFLSLFLLALSAASAQAAPVLGIGDQRPENIAGDPYAAQLALRQIRFTIPIDSTDGGWPQSDADRQMFHAREIGLDPLVVFNHSRYPGGAKKLPSVGQFTAYFKAFRARYPWAHQFAPWNESNYVKQKSLGYPKRIAGYYKAMRRECPSCTVLLGTLLDSSNITNYAKQLKRYAGKGKHIWGLHNYSDAITGRDKSIRKLLKVARWPVWLAEVGGMAIYRGDGKYMSKHKFGEKRQAQIVRYIVGPMLKRNKLVKRVYIYQWRAGATVDWDSGLLRPDGNPRPAFQEVLASLKSGRVSR